jgi:type IV fimbrial biogenesis protein FimT
VLIIRKQRGVNLTELLIGIAIVAILLAVAAPNLSNWLQNSQIRNAAESIQNGLQQARIEAARRNVGVQFILGTGSSWTVGCVTTVADADADGVDECPATITSYTNGDGSRNASIVASQSTIVFNGLGRVVPVPASDLTFQVSNPIGGNCMPAGAMRCLRVVVTQGGQVRMCDPSRSSSDPRAC